MDAERLRFDFSAPAALSAEQVGRVEELVNQQIVANTPVQTREMSMQDALEQGALALFGEKYADRVRVLTMGDGFSVELCGGTHVQRTGDIGLFVLVMQESVAAGVRRVEALTGAAALQWVQRQREQLRGVAEAVGGSAEDAPARIDTLRQQLGQLQGQLDEWHRRDVASAGAQLSEQAVAVGQRYFLVAQLGDAAAPSDMRTASAWMPAC